MLVADPRPRVVPLDTSTGRVVSTIDTVGVEVAPPVGVPWVPAAVKET